jgi:hypothetical protein
MDGSDGEAVLVCPEVSAMVSADSLSRIIVGIVWGG